MNNMNDPKDLSNLLDRAVEASEPLAAKPHEEDHLTTPRRDRADVLGQDARWAAGWALRFIIVVIASVILWRGLAAIWVGLLPVMLAILVATVLWPPVAWLRARKVPPALAVIIVIVAFFALIAGVVSAIAPSVASQSQDLINRASEGINRILQWLQGPPLNLDTSTFDQYLDQARAWVQGQSSNIASSVFSGVSVAGSIVVTMVLVLVLTFFFLKDGTKFLPMVRRMTGPNVGWHLSEALTRVWNTLGGFIRTQAIVSLVDAVFIGIGLVVLNVPLALAIAVLTFFGGFIPIIGAFTAGTIAVVVALVSNGLTNALLVLGLIILVQQIEGNVLQPILQSRAMNLHAAVVLLSVTVGSALFGIIGAFLAVPVAATIAVLIRYHSELVGLRAGEITLDDIEMATNGVGGPQTTPQEAWGSFMERLNKLSLRKQKNTNVVAESKPLSSTEAAAEDTAGDK